MTMNIRIGVMPRRLHPKAATTPLALRRVCGVCRHFAGAGIALPGVCTRFEADVHGRASADRCDDWGRRLAGVDAPAEVRPVRAARVAADRDAAPAGEMAVPVSPDAAAATVPARRTYSVPPGPKRNPDTAARRERVRVLAADGKTLREAAALIGITYETVRRDARAAGIRFPVTPEKLRRPRQAQKNPALRDELVARISAGEALDPVREIAARHGVAMNTVYAMASRIRRQVRA